MQNKPFLNNAVFTQVIIIAIIADALQLPFMLGELFGFTIPFIEVLDIGIDIGMMIFLIQRLGFHWALLPTFALEALPIMDLSPTWTGCVAFVIWQRKKELERQAKTANAFESKPNGHTSERVTSLPPIIETRRAAPDIQDAEIIEESPNRAATPPPIPNQPIAENGKTIENRLERVARLHREGVINEDELKTKRQQILNEL